MKQVPFWRPTNIGYCHRKFSCLGFLDHCNKVFNFVSVHFILLPNNCFASMLFNDSQLLKNDEWISMVHWWNDSDGKTKVFRETCATSTSSTTIRTRTGLCSERMATDCLHHGTHKQCPDECVVCSIFSCLFHTLFLFYSTELYLKYVLSFHICMYPNCYTSFTWCLYRCVQNLVFVCHKSCWYVCHQ